MMNPFICPASLLMCAAHHVQVANDRSFQHLFCNQTMRYPVGFSPLKAEKATRKKQLAGETVGTCLPESVIKELLGFRDRKFDITMRSGDDMHGNKLSHPLGSCAACICSGFDRTDITAHKHRYQAAAHKLPTHEFHLSRLYHCIGSLNGAHHTSGFYHTQRLFSHCLYLLFRIKGLRPNGILECWKNGIMGFGLMGDGPPAAD
jgi:hypothetical protein